MTSPLVGSIGMGIEEEVKRALNGVVQRLEDQGHEAVERAVDRAVTDWALDWSRHHHHHGQHAATTAVLKFNQQGDQMPGAINVDTTNETVTLSFVDDHGDTDAAAPVSPSGNPIVVTFVSDNTAVVTVAPDATNPLVGDITTVAEGVANVSATIANDDGTPVLEADGVTPFPAPDAVALTVSAGAAVGEKLVLSV